jgi:RNA polymerase sigma-70 factor (ECF subfamily)
VRLSEPERRELLEQLFDRHYAAILAYGLRRAPRTVAEDIASETFVVAWRRIDEVPSQPLPWLYGVARKLLANERRAQSRRDRLDLRLRDEAPLVAAWGSAEGEPPPMLEAIAQLPEPEREALLLTAWEGLSGAEAAAAAGCSRVAMRARVYRARRRLSALVPAEDGDAAAASRESARATPCPSEGCNVVERSS